MFNDSKGTIAMFTFECQYAGSAWTRSGKQWHTWDAAMKAAVEFAHVVYENDEVCAIRVVKV